MDAPGLGFNLFCSQRELPILLADRVGYVDAKNPATFYTHYIYWQDPVQYSHTVLPEQEVLLSELYKSRYCRPLYIA